MFSLRSLFGGRSAKPAGPVASPDDVAPPPTVLQLGESRAFDVEAHLARREGYPFMDWDAVHDALLTVDAEPARADAFAEVQRAWLLHMRLALGEGFRLQTSEHAMLLSSLEPNVAAAMLGHMDRTRRRVRSVLDGVADVGQTDKDILIVFDDEESYYRYVSDYYPDGGEFALSGGMHIDAGCSHCVTLKADLRQVEPVIAHEMTHGCVRHLPLPVWLNEGLAVNVEQRLSPTPATHTPQQLHAMHRSFWGPREIQEFWSGASFLRTDEGNLLSYDLARLLVEQLSRVWAPFKQFVLAADAADAGAQAARDTFEIDLGEVVCAMLEKDAAAGAWAPKPTALSLDAPGADAVAVQPTRRVGR